MIILPKAKLVIVENPKCGSSSIKQAFTNLFYEPKNLRMNTTFAKHAPAAVWRKNLAQLDEYQGFTSLAICRDPMEWVCSWYKFWNKPKFVHNSIDLSFSQFVENYLEHKYKATNFKTQSHYLDYRGSIGINYLIRLENLGDVFEIAKSRWEGDMPDVQQTIANKSANRPIEALGEKLKEDLKSHLSRDWDIYNKSKSNSRFCC